MKHLIVIAGVLGALIGAGAAMERQNGARPEGAEERRRVEPVDGGVVGVSGGEISKDGLIVCTFIADEFGDAALRKVLTSGESTFEKRVHAATGVEYEEFCERLKLRTGE